MAVLMAIPTHLTAGFTIAAMPTLVPMQSLMSGSGRPGRPRIWVRVGSWHMISASGWAPCNRPRLTPA